MAYKYLVDFGWDQKVSSCGYGGQASSSFYATYKSSKGFQLTHAQTHTSDINFDVPEAEVELISYRKILIDPFANVIVVIKRSVEELFNAVHLNSA